MKHKPLDFNKANLGVAIGKTAHYRNPVLMLKLNAMHKILAYLYTHEYEIAHPRLGGGEVDPIGLTKLYEVTRNVWKRKPIP